MSRKHSDVQVRTETAAARGRIAKAVDAGKRERQDATGAVRKVWVVLVALLVGALAFTIWFGAGDQGSVDTGAVAGFTDAAAVAVFVAAIAAGIERLLEVSWGVIDRSTAGSWWPLSVVTATITDAEIAANKFVADDLQNVAELLGDAKALVDHSEVAADEAAKTAELIQARVSAAKTGLANAAKLAPGSARFSAIARVGDDLTQETLRITRDAGLYSEALQNRLAQLNDGIVQATDIVSGFSDNPARRSMSIAAGTAVALVVAGYLKLNIFYAFLTADAPTYLKGVGGVIATGIVMGLGTNPTHEVIKALQKRREDRTTEDVVSSIIVPAVPGAVARPAAHPQIQVDTLDSIGFQLLSGHGASAGTARFRSNAPNEIAPAAAIRRTTTIRRTS
jgi:hypothetical protein